MANNQYVNKVVFGNTTLIDLTSDDVQRTDVMVGVVFHLPTGEQVTGTIVDGDNLGYGGVAIVGSAIVGTAVVA